MKLKRQWGSPLVLLLCFALILLVGLLTTLVPIPWDVALIGAALSVLSLVPIFRWIRAGSATVPIVELISASIGLQYGFAVFSMPNFIVVFSQLIELPWPLMRKSLGIAALGIVAFQAGLWCTTRVLFRAIVPRFDLAVHAKSRGFLIGTCICLGFLGFVLKNVGTLTLGAIVPLLVNLNLVAVALLTGYIYETVDRERRGAKLVLFIYLPTIVLLGMLSGMLEAAVLPLFVHLVFRVARSREVPVVTITCLLLVLAVLNTAKAAYRNATWQASASGSEVSQLGAWAEALLDFDISRLFGRDPESGEISATRALLYRLSLLNRLAWVKGNTPETVPYFEGESYKGFIYTPIPRVLWPEKPRIASANTLLDYAYMLRDPRGPDTYSIGIGIIAEGYANFSWPGVAVVMGLFGFAMGILNCSLNSRQSDGGAAILLVVTCSLINGIGAAAVVVCGNMLAVTICYILLILPFSRRVSSRLARVQQTTVTQTSIRQVPNSNRQYREF